MQLFLRIYAVIYLVVFIEGLIFASHGVSHPSVIQLIDTIFFTPVAIVGLWSAAYRHVSLPKHTWQILLFASVFWRPLAIGTAVLSGDTVARFQLFVGGLTAKMSSENAIGVTLLATAGVCLLGSFAFLPPLFALYRNAYGDESLLKLMSPGRPDGSVKPTDRLADISARRAAQRSV